MRTKFIPNFLLWAILAILVCLTILKIVIVPRISPSLSHVPLVTGESIKTIPHLQLTRGDPPFSIYLEKKNNEWMLTLDNSHYYPAIDKMAEDFLHEVSAKRSLYSVGTVDGKPYGIGSKDTLYFSLLDSNDNIVKTIMFGDTDITGNDIYISISGENEIMRTNNTFSDYLTIATSDWVDLSVFAKQIQESEIEEIQYKKGNDTKIFRSPHDSEIANFSRVMESLSCVDITNIDLTPSQTITLTFGDTRSTQISLAALDDEVWILKNETAGLSYIISSATEKNIEESLN
jgi:hypothetical protein